MDTGRLAGEAESVGQVSRAMAGGVAGRSAARRDRGYAAIASDATTRGAVIRMLESE
jgi:hypothetical protein